MKELVVNWHITEACNFKCAYCFAKWEEKPCKKELLHSEESIVKLLDQIVKLPLILKYPFQYIRLNLVGGETFLYRKPVINIIREARKRGIKLSAITNGSKLDIELNKMIAENFDMIGFSIDSLDEITNLGIGRTQGNSTLILSDVIKNVLMIKELNPAITLKINTVVNQLNFSEDFSSFIEQVNPDKWKVFQMLPILKKSFSLAIKEEQFLSFIERHHKYHLIISAEDNDAMRESYLMIDPYGRFFQNTVNEQNYIYSDSILDIGIENAFSSIKFDIEKFLNRY